MPFIYPNWTHVHIHSLRVIALVEQIAQKQWQLMH